LGEDLHNEKILLRLIAEGDEVAFRDLFHSYVPLVQSVVGKLIRNTEAVPDVVQEIFLRIWLARDRLPDIENPRSWILRIVYHQSFNWLRQQKAQRKRDLVLLEEIQSVSTLGTEEAAQFEETSRIVQAAIEQLPPQARKVYLLNREEGLKIGEIAQQLQLSTQTVKNTLGRSVKAIRNYLCREGIFLPICLWALYWIG
jgi:RNA polymerase sigma-70 factor (ECF subfamily)